MSLPAFNFNFRDFYLEPFTINKESFIIYLSDDSDTEIFTTPEIRSEKELYENLEMTFKSSWEMKKIIDSIDHTWFNFNILNIQYKFAIAQQRSQEFGLIYNLLKTKSITYKKDFESLDQTYRIVQLTMFHIRKKICGQDVKYKTKKFKEEDKMTEVIMACALLLTHSDDKTFFEDEVMMKRLETCIVQFNKIFNF